MTTTRHAHRREVCRHGRVTRQCRCVGPKNEIVVDCTHACLVVHGEMLKSVDEYVGKHRAKERV